MTQQKECYLTCSCGFSKRGSHYELKRVMENHVFNNYTSGHHAKLIDEIGVGIQ